MKTSFQLIIITGMSGAGKSTASNFFEDSGFFCMDNVPPSLLPNLMNVCSQSDVKKMAVVIDTRVGSFFNSLIEAIKKVEKMGVDVKTLFLDTSDDVLIRRFSETRRKHPLQDGERIADLIRRERAMLEQTRTIADYIIDTTEINGRELYEKIRQLIEKSLNPRHMSVVFISFGFKHGIPIDCDMVFDLRFLPNPHYIPQLKGLTGLDEEVSSYVFQTETSKTFSKKLKSFIDYLIPQFIEEPRTRLQIGIGCTGGKHRSVAYTEYLFQKIEHANILKSRQHRDIKL